MLSSTAPPRVDPPPLPEARGPLSAAVLARCARTAPGAPTPPTADPYGDDLQLALYCCYELHYRGFAGVPDDREWDVACCAAPRDGAGVRDGTARGRARPATERWRRNARARRAARRAGRTGAGPSWHLRRDGELWQLREYVAHRSLYHLKEADPQAWVIARLDGPAKAALVTVEHDEYGAGDPDRMHARLFADMMAALGLSTAYGDYLDAAPAATLAEVNFMSLCGLHRRCAARWWGSSPRSS